ncbi:MAG: tetratricopeptide repeat protein [Gammaproteobacteria bacterium]|nr:tetratricopeptide repeat protein [Gammaproteobacteria bacterium]
MMLATIRGRIPVLVCCLALVACSSEAPRVYERPAVMTPMVDERYEQIPLLELRQLAASSYETDEFDRAERLYRALTLREPADADHWLRLGNVYGRSSRPEEAVAAYQEAVLRDPGLAKAWHNMGVIRLQQAANSFQQLLVHAAADEPLVATATQTRIAILGLLQGGVPPAVVTSGAGVAEPGEPSDRSAPAAVPTDPDRSSRQ